MVNHCRSEAGEAIADLRATRKTEGSLALQLDETLRERAAKAGIDLTIETEGELFNLSPRVSHHLSRIASEAVTNAIRHSEARSIKVVFRYSGELLSILIEDDGIGFEPSGEVPAGRFGLMGMKERAGRIGAEIKIESERGSGSRILVKCHSSA